MMITCMGSEPAAKSINSFDEDDDVIIADKDYFVNDDTIIIDEIDDIDLQVG